MALILRSLIVLALLVLPLPALALEGRARVVDGDTLDVGGRVVRLFGIDAPELTQTCQRDGRDWACGQAARKALAEIVAGRRLACAQLEVDGYGRDVATCTAGGQDVAALMVRQGLAIAFRRYSDRYVGEEAAARAEGAGVWGSTYVPHDEFRQQGRVQVAPQPVPDGGCAIKGNIGRNGARIYHLPGQADYEATRINERTGERWFCTEAEARAAGYRRAAR